MTLDPYHEIDWRFLVEIPEDGFRHLLVLGATSGTIELIRQAGIARRINSQPSANGYFDGIIVLAGYDADPLAALSGLKEGGSLYIERDRRGQSGHRPSIRQLDAELTRLGISSAAWYWCVPNTAARTAYLPLGRTDIQRWYLRNLTPDRSARRELSRHAFEIGTLLVPALANRFASSYALAAIKGSRRRPIPSYIRLTAGQLPTSVPWTDLAFITRPGRRVVALPFTHRASAPLVVLKMSRSPSRNEITHNEQQALQQIRGRLDVRLATTIPRPFGSFDWFGLTVGIESAADGQLMLASTRGWRTTTRRHIANLRQVARWLADFHRATEIERSAAAARQLAESASWAFGEFQQRFGASESRAGLFSEIEQLAITLAATKPAALVWSQSDLEDGNVFQRGAGLLRHAPGITVIDWAGAHVRSALVDLIYFISHWSRWARNASSPGEQIRVFGEVFLDLPATTALARAARTEMLRYLSAMALDPAYLPVILVLFWTEEALYRADRVAELAREAQAAGEAQRQLFIGYVDEIAARYARSWPRSLASRYSVPG